MTFATNLDPDQPGHWYSQIWMLTYCMDFEDSMNKMCRLLSDFIDAQQSSHLLCSVCRTGSLTMVIPRQARLSMNGSTFSSLASEKSQVVVLQSTVSQD